MVETHLCETRNQNCYQKTQLICFSCGCPTCDAPGCSSEVEYYHWGVQVICLNCLDQRQEDTPALEKGFAQTLLLQCTGAGMTARAAKVQVEEWLRG